MSEMVGTTLKIPSKELQLIDQLIDVARRSSYRSRRGSVHLLAPRDGAEGALLRELLVERGAARGAVSYRSGTILPLHTQPA